MAGPSRPPLGAANAFVGIADELGRKPRVALLVAPYYADVAEALVAGARAELDKAGAQIEVVEVPGALELPQAFELVAGGADGEEIDGYVAIGCVIRGETSHYDIVCTEANRGLNDIARERRAPLGNALLTVDTHEQAMARATAGETGKGGDAARAALSLIRLKNQRGDEFEGLDLLFDDDDEDDDDLKDVDAGSDILRKFIKRGE